MVFGFMDIKTQKMFILSTDQQMHLNGSLSQNGTESFTHKDLSLREVPGLQNGKVPFAMGKDPEEPGQGKSACWDCPGGEGCGSLESETILC